MASPAIDAVTQVLLDAKINVEVTNRGSAIGNGRVWVLMDEWLREGFAGEQIQIVAAVAWGQHERLSNLTDEVLTALWDGGYRPAGFTAEYSVESPVSGVVVETACDIVTIVVPTPGQRPTPIAP